MTEDALSVAVAPSMNGADPPPRAGPRMDPETMGAHLLGDIAVTVSDVTGVAYAGAWGSLMVTVGTYLGRGPSLRAAGEHHAVIFTALVGRSAGGKGYAHASVVDLLEPTMGEWLSERITTGINSGEVLVDLVADELDGDAVDGHDHRLVLHEQELSRLIKVDHRGGTSIFALLREAYDSPARLQTQSRGRKAVARNPHIGMAVHVTPADLAAHVDPADLRNGVANRIMWCWVEMEEFRAFGPGPGWCASYGHLHSRLAQVLADARLVTEMEWSSAARAMWDREAPRLHAAAAHHPDPLDALMARATTVIPRLCLVLAITDDRWPAPRRTVHEVHIATAIDIWESYVEPSTIHVWGAGGVVVAMRQSQAERDEVESEPPWKRRFAKLHAALCVAGRSGLTRRQILHDVFSGHVRATEVQSLIAQLTKDGWAQEWDGEAPPQGPRPTVVVVTNLGVEMRS